VFKTYKSLLPSHQTD